MKTPKVKKQKNELLVREIAQTPFKTVQTENGVALIFANSKIGEYTSHEEAEIVLKSITTQWNLLINIMGETARHIVKNYDEINKYISETTK